MVFWLVAVILSLAGLMAAIASGTAGLDSLPAIPIAGIVIALLITVYAATAKGRGFETPSARKAIAATAALAAIAAVAGYALNRPMALGGLIPGTATAPRQDFIDSKDSPHSVRLRIRDTGQFIARAEVNGAGIDLLVDTGASSVILKHADAEKAGIDTSVLAFTTPVKTANGTAFAAPVRIRSIAIGPVRLDGIEALVAKPGSVNESLLGMTFLRRLRSYDLAGDFLTLRQ